MVIDGETGTGGKHVKGLREADSNHWTVTNILILLWERKIGRGSKRKAEKGDKQEKQVQWRDWNFSFRNKKHIDRMCQSAEVNESWRRGRRGARKSCCLGGKVGNGKRKQTKPVKVSLQWMGLFTCSFTEMMQAAGSSSHCMIEGSCSIWIHSLRQVKTDYVLYSFI